MTKNRSAKGAAVGASPRLLADQARAVQQHEADLPEQDAVHDMRVATRRLRAALRVLRLGKLDRRGEAPPGARGPRPGVPLQLPQLRGPGGAPPRAGRARVPPAER